MCKERERALQRSLSASMDMQMPRTRRSHIRSWRDWKRAKVGIRANQERSPGTHRPRCVFGTCYIRMSTSRAGSGTQRRETLITLATGRGVSGRRPLPHRCGPRIRRERFAVHYPPLRRSATQRKHGGDTGTSPRDTQRVSTHRTPPPLPG